MTVQAAARESNFLQTTSRVLSQYCQLHCVCASKTRCYPDGGTVSAAGPSRPYFHKKSIQNLKSVKICYF